MNGRRKIFGETGCGVVIAELFPYLDNEVDAKKRDFIERHLKVCPGCHARAEFESALRSKVRQLGGNKAPPSLRRRISAMLKEK